MKQVIDDRIGHIVDTRAALAEQKPAEQHIAKLKKVQQN